MIGFYSFIRQSFNWKKGKYSLIIEIESPDKYSIIGNKYEFSIDSTDITDLDKNKENIEIYYKNDLNSRLDEAYVFQKINWNWIYPNIKQV